MRLYVFEKAVECIGMLFVEQCNKIACNFALFLNRVESTDPGQPGVDQVSQQFYGFFGDVFTGDIISACLKVSNDPVRPSLTRLLGTDAEFLQVGIEQVSYPALPVNGGFSLLQRSSFRHW